MSNAVDLSKSPRRISAMFDAIAPRYDFLNHVLSAGIDRYWRMRAIRSLRLTGRERVLDVCTGTADLAIAARTAKPGAARVVGVDFAGAMLGMGREKLKRAGLAGTVTLVRGDATRIPAADASVDAVTVAFGIRNVDDTPAACDPDSADRQDGVPDVLPSHSSGRRASHFATQRGLRVSSRLRRNVCHAGSADGHAASERICGGGGRPDDVRDRLSLYSPSRWVTLLAKGAGHDAL
jgi:SAM-dependent methyltransferase